MATTARAKKKPAAKKPAATKKPTKATPTPKVLTGPDGATPRYLAFLAREKDEHQGRSVWGLPGETADTRLKVQFEKPGEWRTFTAAGLDPSAPAHAGSVPLAKLGGTGKFLTVKITDPRCPVAVFDPDDGALHAAFPSLDAFLAVLVDKSTRTPHDRLDAAVEKANTLQEKERWTDALELIEPLLDEIPAHVRLEGDDTLARAFNLRGICFENTGRIDDALAAYEKSLLAGDLRAALNVLDVYEDARPDPAKLVERGEAMKRELFFMDAYGATWLRRYLARAYFELGKPREAEVQLRELLERFEVKEPERIDEARAGLEAYVKERSGTPGAALAAAALQWFKKKSYDVSPEEAKRNREWWNAQTPELRAALVKGTGLDGDAEPTDAQLARCFDVESISLRIEGSDLSSFTRFPRLKRVILEGDPDTLEPLRALSLQRITINNVLYKSVDEWPSRAERDLLNAARKADREGLERALAAGADVNARDRWGATPSCSSAGLPDTTRSCSCGSSSKAPIPGRPTVTTRGPGSKRRSCRRWRLPRRPLASSLPRPRRGGCSRRSASTAAPRSTACATSSTSILARASGSSLRATPGRRTPATTSPATRPTTSSSTGTRLTTASSCPSGFARGSTRSRCPGSSCCRWPSGIATTRPAAPTGPSTPFRKIASIPVVPTRTGTTSLPSRSATTPCWPSTRRSSTRSSRSSGSRASTRA